MNQKGNSAFQKIYCIIKTGQIDLFFPYDLLTVNECLSNTLEKAKSGTNSSQQTMRKDNLNEQIFAHHNINSMRNKF